MAGSITYNPAGSYGNCLYVFRATAGGTVFSANLAGGACDLFTDTAVANDAIYFSARTASYNSLSDVRLVIDTALVADAIDLVWEYYNKAMSQWVEIPYLTDNTNSLQSTGTLVVAFPLPPYNEINRTVNSVGANYVRCRIVSVSNLTEGGHISAAAQVNYGIVTTYGYTEASPLTSTILYNWIIANTPIPAKKYGSIFIFPCAVQNSSDSYWRTQNEQLFFGNGGGLTAAVLGLMVSGEAIGTAGASRNGSAIFHCYTTGGSGINLSTAKLYGSIVSTYTYADDVYSATTTVGISTLASVSISIIQATIVKQAGYFNPGVSAQRAICLGSNISTSAIGDGNYFTDMIISSNYCFAFYTQSQIYRDIVIMAIDYVAQKNAAGANVDVTFINPTPRLPNALETGYPRIFNKSSWVNGYDFEIYEKFTLNIKTIDFAGNSIEGASITLADDSGILSDIVKVTDSNGDSGEFLLRTRRYYYSNGSGQENTASEDTLYWTATITKSGYQTKITKLYMDRKREEVIALEKVKHFNFSKHAVLIAQ